MKKEDIKIGLRIKRIEHWAGQYAGSTATIVDKAARNVFIVRYDNGDEYPWEVFGLASSFELYIPDDCS